MDLIRSIHTVDAHCAGEPLRVVLGGLPRIPGNTVLEQRAWLRENLDDVRVFLMHEPRGHADMYGAYLLPPISEKADFAVTFIHNQGYSDMCGHGIIALGKVIVELGLVQRTMPETRIGFDAPAGFIEAHVRWDGKKAGTTRFTNVPAFIFKRDYIAKTEHFGNVRTDIVFGGAFYGYFSGTQVGLRVRPEQIRQHIDCATEVKQAVSAGLAIQHPTEPGLNTLYGCIIDGEPVHAGSRQNNICVFADREVDRSPTGTGTSGRAAQLFLRGELALGESFINESVIGTRFAAKVTAKCKVGEFDAAITEVSGSASIVGFNHLVLERDDEIPGGFFVR